MDRRVENAEQPVLTEQATPEPPSRPLDVAQLVTEHHAAVYRYAFRLTGSTADAEDLTQQTFLTAQQKLAQVRQPERIRSWLLAVLRSHFLKARRRPPPLTAVDLELNVDQLPGPEAETPQIDGEQLQWALDQLPDSFKLVVVMFYYQGVSYKQIAAELDVPIGTVMSRLARAKQHLRRRLSSPDAPRPR